MRQRGCNVARWTFTTMPHKCQQDGTSCGVLALKFAECILMGGNLDIETTEEGVATRQQIAETLLEETDNLENLCFSCGKEQHDDIHWICCELCDRWFNHSCVQRPPMDKEFRCPACC
ncbi:hypothetical protein MATL_G00101600 [Megalops atlanticus]|uniref:PHD finger protein Alfin1 n=1 Tax=Megalops atlanticus TaxID=7932 RepID=A0A9D3Q2W0_MEGAT|nr:hypothetical protein MATL_G00101600 [Megalops atlanticus]